ncbi:hypothetical protein [Vibrio sp. 10N.261.46.A3]|uniref:hypothetical protein n=1 Tax=Vibrio sp. 10N.261.46.A3 TaxID=3229658 RepID=UPI003550E81D
MNNNQLIEWEDGLYLDGFVISSDNKVQFLSLWGRDGMIQHFLASLTLPSSEGGLRVKSVRLPNHNTVTLDFANAKSLKKQTARLDKYSVVGEWVHLWLMDDSLTQPKPQSLTLIHQSPHTWSALWPVVKQLCHLPLLDAWKAPLEGLFAEYIESLPSFGVHGTEISLPIEDIEPLISDAIQMGILPLTFNE